MKILVIPDSFKGSLDSFSVAKAIKKGLLKANKSFEIDVVPFSDGGDGFISALNHTISAKLIKKKVTSPYIKKKVLAGYLTYKGMAIIEMAQASGLNLLNIAEYNPMKTTTLGTGELIKDAVCNKNIKKIILGLGGSATVDVGLGILSSLGIKFVDKNRKAVHPSGSGVGDISDIIITPEFDYYMDTEFIVASDVTNPLIGPEGAARVYAPQKGATPTDVKKLEKYICQFCRIIKLKQKRDISSFKGGGAAGGIAAGLKAFFNNVTIKSGAELFFEIAKQKIKIKNYDLIITGEGKVDSQTLKGKAVKFIIDQANANGKDVIIICGRLGQGYKQIYKHGVIHIEDILKYAKDLNDSMKNTAKLIEKAASRIILLHIPL